jgi:hypothetical protein
MDTKTLVIGQKVRMQSGDLFKEAIVEEITKDYVRVFIAPSGPFTKWLPKPEWMLKPGESQPPRPAGEMPSSPENENGFSLDFRYDGTPCGMVEAGGVWDHRPLCTKFGPWKLVDKHTYTAGN